MHKLKLKTIPTVDTPTATFLDCYGKELSLYLPFDQLPSDNMVEVELVTVTGDQALVAILVNGTKTIARVSIMDIQTVPDKESGMDAIHKELRGLRIFFEKLEWDLRDLGKTLVALETLVEEYEDEKA